MVNIVKSFLFTSHLNGLSCCRDHQIRQLPLNIRLPANARITSGSDSTHMRIQFTDDKYSPPPKYTGPADF